MPFEIVPLQSSHIGQAAEVHLKSFKDFFLSFLGRGFLRHFYASFIHDSEGVGFVAINQPEGDVIGVVVGPVSPQGYFGRLVKKRWWAFCLASTWAIIRRPTAIKRLFRAVFYRGSAPQGPPRALMSSIAVSPDHQKDGVGRELMNAWVNEVRNRGAGGIYMTTDALDNDPVNQFYQKQGCRIESTFETPEGRKMNRYVLDFPPNDGEQQK